MHNRVIVLYLLNRRNFHIGSTHEPASVKGQHFTLYKAISWRKSTPAMYRMTSIPLKYLILFTDQSGYCWGTYIKNFKKNRCPLHCIIYCHVFSAPKIFYQGKKDNIFSLLVWKVRWDYNMCSFQYTTLKESACNRIVSGYSKLFTVKCLQ